jgi:hypothetical protein
LEREQVPAASTIFSDWNALMKRKSGHPSFNQTLELLRAHGFDAVPYAGVAGGALVSKHGVGAVLVPAPAGTDAAVAVAVHSGVLVRGEVSRLLDRGYQKFIKTWAQPATSISTTG